MEAQHTINEGLFIVLTSEDIMRMRARGDIAIRGGLLEENAHTKVVIDPDVVEPIVEIDDNKNASVYLPTDKQSLPFTIERDRIQSVGPSGRDNVEFFFGKTGRVVLQHHFTL